jgi:hypothetical protein
LCKDIGQSVELNEGSHRLTLIRKNSDLVASASGPTLSMKIYNPINGRPEEFKVLNTRQRAKRVVAVAV